MYAAFARYQLGAQQFLLPKGLRGTCGLQTGPSQPQSRNRQLQAALAGKVSQAQILASFLIQNHRIPNTTHEPTNLRYCWASMVGPNKISTNIRPYHRCRSSLTNENSVTCCRIVFPEPGKKVLPLQGGRVGGEGATRLRAFVFIKGLRVSRHGCTSAKARFGVISGTQTSNSRSSHRDEGLPRRDPPSCRRFGTLTSLSHLEE